MLLIFLLFVAQREAEGGYEITLLYEDVEGLRKGDPVILAGERVGKVRSVGRLRKPPGRHLQRQVAVSVESEYRDLLYHQMCFVVEGRGESLAERTQSDRSQITVREPLLSVQQPIPVRTGEWVMGTTNTGCFGRDLLNLAGVVLEEISSSTLLAGSDLSWLDVPIAQLQQIGPAEIDRHVGLLLETQERLGEASVELSEQTQVLAAVLKSIHE